MTIENSEYNATTLSGKVAVTGQADNAQRIAVMFDYITDETSSVEADITDNWVESNYTIQDHIAIKPRIYRLRGCVGEVLYQDTYAFEKFFDNFTSNHALLQKTTDVVNAVTSLSGIVSNYTRAAINLSKQIERSLRRYNNIWRNFSKQNQFIDKRQKAVYLWFQTVLQSRTPVKLVGMMFDYTSGAIGLDYEKEYYLQSVSAHQGENAYISDIEITVKEFRIAQSKTTKIDKSKFGGIVAEQKTSEANNGSAKSRTITITEKDLEDVSKENDKTKGFFNKIKTIERMPTGTTYDWDYSK